MEPKQQNNAEEIKKENELAPEVLDKDGLRYILALRTEFFVSLSALELAVDIRSHLPAVLSECAKGNPTLDGSGANDIILMIKIISVDWTIASSFFCWRAVSLSVCVLVCPLVCIIRSSTTPWSAYGCC
jgi:hypothetical protein